MWRKNRGARLTKDDDWESVSLSTNPKFLVIIERSAATHKPGTGISGEEMRRRLGLSKRKARKAPRRFSRGSVANR